MYSRRRLSQLRSLMKVRINLQSPKSVIPIAPLRDFSAQKKRVLPWLMLWRCLELGSRRTWEGYLARIVSLQVSRAHCKRHPCTIVCHSGDKAAKAAKADTAVARTLLWHNGVDQGERTVAKRHWLTGLRMLLSASGLCAVRACEIFCVFDGWLGCCGTACLLTLRW